MLLLRSTLPSLTQCYCYEVHYPLWHNAIATRYITLLDAMISLRDILPLTQCYSYEGCQQSSMASKDLDYRDLCASVAEIIDSCADTFTQVLLAALHATLRWATLLYMIIDSCADTFTQVLLAALHATLRWVTLLYMIIDSCADTFTQVLLAAVVVKVYSQLYIILLRKTVASCSRHECDVLLAVLQVMHSIQRHDFLPALLHLDTAHDALQLWQKTITCKEVLWSQLK